MSGLRADVGLRLGALDVSVELAVAPGETVAVLGPNGAGKTTFLRALAGLHLLDAGRVVLDGKVLEDAGRARVPSERRSVAMVFQDLVLFPHLSALDNVAFGLRARGAGKADSRRQAGEWLDRMGLSPLAQARPAQLSGGEAQRVALARALAPAPRLLLLDEPLAALDASTRAATRRDLRDHLAACPGVRLVITHDPLEAAALADRLVVVEGGRVVQQGSLAELTARPRSRYVADLVGVNLFAGRGEGARVRVGGGFLLTVAEPAAGDVLVAVPPRAVTLHRRRPDGSPRNVWEGRVTTVEHEGDRARILLAGPVAVVAEVTAAAAGEPWLAAGGPVWVAVKATEIHVFRA